MTEATRNNLIRHTHVLVTVGVLVTAVWTLRTVTGLSFLIVMLPAGVVLLIVSKVVVQRLLPPVPQWSDEERVQMPRVRPMWGVLGIAAVSLFCLGTRMPIPISLLLVVVLIGPLILVEQHERRKAEHRLETKQESATSC